jgi:hypothetical protein
VLHTPRFLILFLETVSPLQVSTMDNTCTVPVKDDSIERYAEKEVRVMFISDEHARYLAGCKLVEEIASDPNINARIHSTKDAENVINQIDKRAKEILACHKQNDF